MILFAASAVVVVLSSLLNFRISGAFYEEHKRRSQGAGLEPRSLPPMVPYGVSSSVIKSWFNRALDIAAGFPAAVLTASALLGLDLFDSDYAQAILLIVVVIATAVVMWSIDPRKPPLRTFFGLSLLSWALILVNCIGAVIVIIQRIREPHF